jgi:hypothetical protein
MLISQYIDVATNSSGHFVFLSLPMLAPLSHAVGLVVRFTHGHRLSFSLVGDDRPGLSGELNETSVRDLSKIAERQMAQLLQHDLFYFNI